MADQSDVAATLAAMIAAALYPNGTNQPSVVGAPVIVYPGWPNPQTLDADMAAGKAHVSVFPRPGDVVTSLAMGDAEWVETVNNGTSGTSALELRRQTKQFQVTVWAPTPPLRDAIGKICNVVLAATSRFNLPDTTQATMAFVTETQSDEAQKVLIYRRDIFVSVNFALVETEAEFTILSVLLNVGAGPSATDHELMVSYPLVIVPVPQMPTNDLLLEDGLSHLLTEAGGGLSL